MKKSNNGSHSAAHTHHLETAEKIKENVYRTNENHTVCIWGHIDDNVTVDQSAEGKIREETVEGQ